MYDQVGSASSPNILMPGRPEAAPDTLSGIASTADQVDASVRDVLDAWNALMGRPAPAEQPVADAGDRLANVTVSLQFSTGRLRDLANEIRRRA